MLALSFSLVFEPDIIKRERESARQRGRQRESTTEGETERARERESVEESNQAERKSMENLILGITTHFERK